MNANNRRAAMLSDEECREIWQTSMARCHPMNDISVAGIRTAKAAYALGVEQTTAALSKPASDDAWLRKSLQLTANIRDATDDESSAAYFDQLEHHLRTRPAREGFVSVNEQTIRAAAEVMEKEFANLGNFSCTKEVWADKIRGWLFIREPVERSLRKAMIEAAKGDGK